jgi:hypothetical protein
MAAVAASSQTTDKEQSIGVKCAFCAQSMSVVSPSTEDGLSEAEQRAKRYEAIGHIFRVVRLLDW